MKSRLSGWVISTLVLCLSCFLSIGSTANASIHWRTDAGRAAKEATRAGKPLLIEVSTSWCHYCVKMKRETFTDSTIIDKINTCFVPLRLDGDIDKALVQQLGIRSFPATVILSPQMSVLAKIKGFRTVAELSADLAKICAHRDDSRSSISAAASKQQSVFGDYCPVTSLKSRELVNGEPDFPLRFRGFDLQFASLAARDEFKTNPARFWPMGDGYCVVSVFDQGHPTLGTLSHSLIFADRVWLFASRDHLERFAERPNYYAEKLIEAAKTTNLQTQRNSTVRN